MSRTFQTTLLLFILSAVVMAGPKYYVNMGISKPFSPESFQSNWRTGFELGGGVGFMLSEKIELVPAFHYNNFSLNDANYLSEKIGSTDYYSSVTGGSVHIFDLGADIKFLVPSKNIKTVTPYLVAGAGFASHVTSQMDIITTTDESSNSFIEEKQTTNNAWIGGGLGFEISVGKNTYIFVEGRLNTLFTDEPTAYAPLKFGILVK